MPIVRITCPGCRFTMQMDRTLPAQIACPNCRARFVAQASREPAAPAPQPVQAARPMATPAAPPKPRPPAQPADVPWWEDQSARSTVAPPPPTPPRPTSEALRPIAPPAPPRPMAAPPEAPTQPVRWGLLAAAGGGVVAVMALAVVMVVLALPSKKPAPVVRNDDRIAANDDKPDSGTYDPGNANKDRDKLPGDRQPEQKQPEQKQPEQKQPEQKLPPLMKEPEGKKEDRPPPFTTPKTDDTKRDTVNAVLDSFGNPKDRSFSLAKDDEFKGKRLLAYCNIDAIRRWMFQDNSPLWVALRKKGFEVTLKGDAFDPKWLDNADQLWIFSSNVTGMDAKGYDAVEKFIKAGKGVYLLSDDEPLTQESNALVKRLYGGEVKGDYLGQKIAVVKGRGLSKDQIAKFTTNTQRSTGHYEVKDHVLLTGLNFFWEGETISHVVTSDRLEAAVLASDGKCLIAVSKVPRQRVVVDCGWTRYYPMFITNTAGTLRLAENVAGYLQKGGK